MAYFTHFSNIVRNLQNVGQCPTQLQDIFVMEQSRDRFTTEEFARAVEVLGFGYEGTLRIDYDEEVPEDFLEGAWRECVKKSWRDPEHSAEMQRQANEAFRIVAEARGSVRLRKIWEMGKDKLMNPARAYDTLEVPNDVEDTMLITIFSMRVCVGLRCILTLLILFQLEEQPLQIDKMREALLVIAEIRESERLRQFLETGQDRRLIVIWRYRTYSSAW